MKWPPQWLKHLLGWQTEDIAPQHMVPWPEDPPDPQLVAVQHRLETELEAWFEAVEMPRPAYIQVSVQYGGQAADWAAECLAGFWHKEYEFTARVHGTSPLEVQAEVYCSKGPPHTGPVTTSRQLAAFRHLVKTCPR